MTTNRICHTDMCTRGWSHTGPCSYGERNPWADQAPDCDRGHQSRDVFRWSYDADDPWPWLCVKCKRRFKA